jgi:hypothetical protein
VKTLEKRQYLRTFIYRTRIFECQNPLKETGKGLHPG